MITIIPQNLLKVTLTHTHTHNESTVKPHLDLWLLPSFNLIGPWWPRWHGPSSTMSRTVTFLIKSINQRMSLLSSSPVSPAHPYSVLIAAIMADCRSNSSGDGCVSLVSHTLGGTWLNVMVAAHEPWLTWEFTSAHVCLGFIFWHRFAPEGRQNLDPDLSPSVQKSDN